MGGLEKRVAASLFAVCLVMAVILVRAATAGPADVEDLRHFNALTTSEFGPESSFFATGIHGDAQTYALIAADPLGHQPHFSIFDPDYRYARSGFAWAASAVVLGNEGLILAGLAIVGAICIGLLGYIAFASRELLGWKTWLLIANPALFLAFVGDTAESLAVLLLTVALLYGSVWSSVGLAMVRPSFLAGLADRRRLFFAGIAAAVVFRVIWLLRFDGSPLAGAGNLDLPFSGLIAEPSWVGLVVTAAGVVTLVFGIRRRSWSWILAGLMVASLSHLVHAVPSNTVRAAALLPVLWALSDFQPVDEPESAREKSRVSPLP